MRKYQTDFDKCDWDGIDEDVAIAMKKLKIAWQASQQALPEEQHEEFVIGVFVPALRNLGQFCADVNEMVAVDDGGEDGSSN